MEKYYGGQDFRCGKRIKANFYKCGDKTKYPHWGCWNRIDTPHPDFHRPEFFGDLILG
ncbi:carbohydrate-binding family 9-like protein [Caldicoprobacter sp.]|uniref:carbohydrate-binding family 9-like protein n=1 Tax=Caldicoprobacter sp. TaxID=2004500 RepID=UPI0039C24CC8